MTSEKLHIELVHPAAQSSGLVKRLTAALGAFHARREQRRVLATLEPLILQDLGLTEADVWREARKRPWES